MSSSKEFIRGYLPVRLSLPAEFGETFIYVKEHYVIKSGGSHKKSVLFVANVPFIPRVRSSVFLEHLFSRFCNVEKVIVIKNPSSEKEASNIEDMKSRMDKRLLDFSLGYTVSESNLFGFHKDDINNEGKYAHVVFPSTKEMKRTFQMIAGNDDNGHLVIEEDELLQLISKTKYLNSQSKQESPVDEETSEKSSNIILKLCRMRKANIISREELLSHCNEVMGRFEDEEKEQERSSAAQTNLPDEDGFVTVTYKKTGRKQFFEEDLIATGGNHSNLFKRKGIKPRSRSKSGKVGSDALDDFYRFQKRESRKRGAEAIREKFEQDIAVVKKMKAQRLYKPF